jgi:DNA-binding NtrC family response regulator
VLAHLAQQTLAALGYEVEYATRSATALARVRDEPERFALVITDQTMPGMTGLQLASRMHELRPDLPIVLMTGNAASFTPEEVEDAGIRQVLQKPVPLHAMCTAVRAALGPRPDVTTPPAVLVEVGEPSSSP